MARDTWRSRKLISFEQFVAVFENKGVCVQEDCFRVLGQLPTVDLRQYTALYDGLDMIVNIGEPL